MIILLLLLQLGLLVVMQLYFLDFMPHYYLIAGVFCTGMVLYLINSGIDPTSKLTWLVVIMLMPAFGGPASALYQERHWPQAAEGPLYLA